MAQAYTNGSAVSALGSPPLVEQTVNLLRKRILAGDYGQDGELPPQGEICLELGVSRSVIREAMSHLQSQRLIEVSQGKRSKVLPMSAEAMADNIRLLMQRSDASLLHLCDVRLTLETEIAARAAERISASALSRLQETLHALKKALSVDERVEADMLFHRIIAQESGNPVFVFLLDALADLLRVSRQKTIGRGGIEPALMGHREILSALEKGDADEARLAMKKHLTHSMQDLKNLSSRSRRGRVSASARSLSNTAKSRRKA